MATSATQKNWIICRLYWAYIYDKYGARQKLQDEGPAVSQIKGDEVESQDKHAPLIHFPAEGLVSSDQAVRFLGMGALKKPEAKMRRLAAEYGIEPVRRGSRTFRWKVEDVLYAKKLMEQKEVRANAAC